MDDMLATTIAKKKVELAQAYAEWKQDMEDNLVDGDTWYHKGCWYLGPLFDAPVATVSN